MSDSLFQSLDFAAMARLIRKAQHTVCYAAPGIHVEVANAIADLSRRLGPELITICLDFDEHVLRMGFGEFAAVGILRDVDINISSTKGLRTGLLVVDYEGYIFTPTALYLEADRRTADAPNAMRLSKEQVMEAMARLSPSAKVIAIALSNSTEEKEKIRLQAVELPSETLSKEQFFRVGKRLEEVPPVKFDVARQVRVFNAYLQYVEMKLAGAAIQRHRLSIPPSIQQLGGSEDLEGRLKTTFDLISKSGKLSSKVLEDRLNGIRKNFTRSLGKDYGRVTLKAAKPHLEESIKAFRYELKAHQVKVEKELQGQLDESRKQIVDYYVPHVLKSPPDAMLGQFLKYSEVEARIWLDSELDGVFPKADDIIEKMQLDVRYKDVTFETLNQRDFLDAVKEAFPRIDWDKAYSEFRAAGEKD
jgi:hypothetical protein